jgi:hypothetical protein
MHGLLQVFLGSQSGLMLMFCIFKLNFEIDIWAIFGLASVLATFSKFWVIFPNLQVTLVRSSAQPKKDN